MRIAYCSADWGHRDDGTPVPGGSGWARVHQIAERLSDAGHRVGIGEKVAVDRKGLLAPLGHKGLPTMLDAEIVVLQRWMHGHAAELTRQARANGQVVIHDIDDWFWGLDPANRAHRTTSKRANPEANRHHYGKAVAAADAVTVSTPFLAKRVRERFGVKTILLRNVVDFRAFPVNTVRPVTSGLVVGWVGALQWRSGDLETMRGILGPFLDASDSTFVHHGWFPGADTDTAAERAGVAPDRAGHTRSAVEPPAYPDLLEGLDVGIVPLAEVAFNRAKSWIKGLEYAAAGVPFVAQATEEYVELARRGAGLVARTRAEWAEHLSSLRDPATRAQLRESGLDAARRLDINHRWTDWEAAYTGLLGGT